MLPQFHWMGKHHGGEFMSSGPVLAARQPPYELQVAPCIYTVAAHCHCTRPLHTALHEADPDEVQASLVQHTAALHCLCTATAHCTAVRGCHVSLHTALCEAATWWPGSREAATCWPQGPMKAACSVELDPTCPDHAFTGVWNHTRAWTLPCVAEPGPTMPRPCLVA